MIKLYTGIGSRETPANILKEMKLIAEKLSEKCWGLRSGAALGADSAFEAGTLPLRRHIYIPWDGFPRESPRHDTDEGVVCFELLLPDVQAKAIAMAESFHPNWPACSQGARKLHARNCLQVLGLDLKTPSDCVLFWTRRINGVYKGGTSQALRIAARYNIPIFEVGTPECSTKVAAMVKDA